MPRQDKKRSNRPAQAKPNGRQRRRPEAKPAAAPSDGLQDQQRQFCLLYLENGFNATLAYQDSHPGCTVDAAGVNGCRALKNARIRAFLNPLLEAAWKPHQMGGEEALGRIAELASSAPDDRVKLQALRTILEQTGKLKNLPDSIDALAAALRGDLAEHGTHEIP